MRVVLGSTLALVAVVMRHTFDGAGLFFRVYASGFGFGFIKLKSMFSMYQ